MPLLQLPHQLSMLNKRGTLARRPFRTHTSGNEARTTEVTQHGARVGERRLDISREKVLGSISIMAGWAPFVWSLLHDDLSPWCGY
ncbi:hypothetical protein B296_00008905 [Ensete ventricosum]|uniref:Uncharacterized protein n=1 Tax=Ensete ventricosum TaxID=4639 RepID=A0A427A673_ENSVE|nr:hypothetical protein B296_00008905 [Ensete ventricosum]